MATPGESGAKAPSPWHRLRRPWNKPTLKPDRCVQAESDLLLLADPRHPEESKGRTWLLTKSIDWRLICQHPEGRPNEKVRRRFLCRGNRPGCRNACLSEAGLARRAVGCPCAGYYSTPVVLRHPRFRSAHCPKNPESLAAER